VAKLTGYVDAVPIPPRRGKPIPVKPQRPPRTLGREAIIDAALSILDAEGLSALTMRRVADELGTGPASLYAHVADKEEMIAAVIDRIFGEVELPDPIDASRWQQQLKEMARAGRNVLGSHRDIARAGLGNVPTGENALALSNAMVGILLAGGVSPTVAGLSVDILALYITATAFEESLEERPYDTEASKEQFHMELQNFFQSLPADRFPHLVSMAIPLTTGDH
jgi:AcrR family transcriptional regulator